MENERLVVRSSRNRRITDVVTWILRISVGSVFIFSGFVKAVDPWGTLYKVDAYLSALSLDILNLQAFSRYVPQSLLSVFC